MELPTRTVTFEHNGKIYSDSYTVDGELLTVTFVMATKSSPLSGDSPEALAVLLLSEMGVESKRDS